MRQATAVVLAGMVVFGAERAVAQEAEGLAGWLSGNVAITSDYTFRGISQTLGGPAIQGGADLAAPSGLYVGLWASSLNFGEDLSAGPRAQIELDAYAGIARELLGVSWQAGVIYYWYPEAASSRNYDFVEGVLSVGRDFGVVAPTVSVSYSPDFFAGSGSAVHVAGELAIPLPSVFSLGLTLGRQWLEKEAVFGAPDYTYWQAGISAEVYGFTLTAAYVDTDLSREACFAGSDLCDGRAVFSLSRSR